MAVKDTLPSDGLDHPHRRACTLSSVAWRRAAVTPAWGCWWSPWLRPTTEVLTVTGLLSLPYSGVSEAYVLQIASFVDLFCLTKGEGLFLFFFSRYFLILSSEPHSQGWFLFLAVHLQTVVKFPYTSFYPCLRPEVTIWNHSSVDGSWRNWVKFEQRFYWGR